MADGEDRERDETLTGIDQRTVNQKDLLWIAIEIILLEIIEVNKDVSDMIKRDISKEIAWQKTSICIKRKK